MSRTDDAIAAARASIARSRTAAPARGSMNDTLVTGAAIGAVVSLPLTGVGIVAGAIVGAGVAALSKD